MDKREIRREFRSTYMRKIPSEKEGGIRSYFERLVKHPDLAMRRELFEIAGNHESLDCRKWAADFIRTHSLPEYIHDFLEMWIREPHEILKEAITNFVESFEVSKSIGLRAAIYLLLDQENKAQKIDPGFEALEVFLQKDPLLLAPIAERLTKIRLREFQRVVSDRAIVINELLDEQEIEEIPVRMGSLSRALRTEDWSFAWQILKSSSFVSIVENFQFFKLSDWTPRQIHDSNLFNYLTEYIGFSGWDSCIEILQEAILDKAHRYQGVKFEVAQEVLKPPTSFTYWSGDIYIEEEHLPGMQKKFLNVKISGFTILYVTIPSSMDIELDKQGLITLLFPISTFTLQEYHWIAQVISRLKDSSDYFERKVFRIFLALQKLSMMQSKKRFSISLTEADFNKIVSRENKESSTSNTGNKGSNFIGFDFGNSTTAICCIDQRTRQPITGKNLLKNPEDPAFRKTKNGLYLPSLIHYRAGGKQLIGFEAEKYHHVGETFKLMKRSLRRGWSAGIKVEERRIRAPEAIKEFILQIVKRLAINPLDIVKIGFTAPVDAPVKYQEILRSALAEAFHIPESLFETFDEATAAILGLKEKIKPNTPTLVIDVGGGTTDVSVISIDDVSPTSQIFAKASEDIGGADIEAIAFYECREELALDIPKSPEFISECMRAKHSLVDTGSMDPIQFLKDREPVTFSIKDINNWLDQEGIVERYYSLLENTVLNANSSGSGNIEQLVLCGGGSKWSLFQEISKRFSKRFLHEAIYFHSPDIFAVASGAARGVMGFSLKTLCPYPIGLLRIENSDLLFETIFPKGTSIPSKFHLLTITPEESDIPEVEIDIRRRRIKSGGERFLLYGKDGVPFLKEGESFTIFEPLQKESHYSQLGWKNILYIDDKGYIQLLDPETSERIDLGSVL